MRHAPKIEDIQKKVYNFFTNDFGRYINSKGIQSRSEVKRYILETIGSYAHEFGYKVYAEKATCFYAHEEKWIYDLHWRVDSEFSRLVRLPLVMEVVSDEEHYGRDQRITDSFLKLMQSKADIRLMAFEFEYPELENMQQYLINLIEQFEGTQPGDCYWIVGWENVPISVNGLKFENYRA
ncbi:hypothetical protein HW932_19475 [Allochromatium humboldtianum]|uniref:Uncharacterized protein n=1 Tax=Allochromatium humboldtianum TaxID=504901 RepID=A0A850RGX4_9GAMM|nr:hypothetical protein [Allochromatium humboldtianum]NVZ11436.1 hypothetical protein [Allochromatium humboldtianum]